MYLACDYWRKQGILDKCDVHYLSGAGVIFDVTEYVATLTELLKHDNIKVHFGVNVNEIDGANKTVFYEEKDAQVIAVRKEMKFDMCHSVPPQSAPDFIKNSPLTDVNNPYAYVEIYENTMQHSSFSNVFALNDCTNAPYSKTGAAICKQAPVVVQKLLAFLSKQPLASEYTGYSACPIPTQYGKLI